MAFSEGEELYDDPARKFAVLVTCCCKQIKRRIHGTNQYERCSSSCKDSSSFKSPATTMALSQDGTSTAAFSAAHYFNEYACPWKSVGEYTAPARNQGLLPICGGGGGQHVLKSRAPLPSPPAPVASIFEPPSPAEEVWTTAATDADPFHADWPHW